MCFTNLTSLILICKYIIEYNSAGLPFLEPQRQLLKKGERRGTKPLTKALFLSVKIIVSLMLSQTGKEVRCLFFCNDEVAIWLCVCFNLYCARLLKLDVCLLLNLVNGQMTGMKLRYSQSVQQAAINKRSLELNRGSKISADLSALVLRKFPCSTSGMSLLAHIC